MTTEDNDNKDHPVQQAGHPSVEGNYDTTEATIKARTKLPFYIIQLL
jgi:hypothetical protein